MLVLCYTCCVAHSWITASTVPAQSAFMFEALDRCESRLPNERAVTQMPRRCVWVTIWPGNRQSRRLPNFESQHVDTSLYGHDITD